MPVAAPRGVPQRLWTRGVTAALRLLRRLPLPR